MDHQTFIFIAGVVVSLLAVAGGVLIYRQQQEIARERDDLRGHRNEYRTNEEYIDYPK